MKTKRSTSEVGHTKNVTNFASLIKILEEMGPRYNPTIPEIKINELKIFSESLNSKVQQLVDKIAPFRSAVASVMCEFCGSSHFSFARIFIFNGIYAVTKFATS
jgi:hypothetical protein